MATVKGVTKQEDTVYIGVANARAQLAGAVKTGDPAQMAAADQAATGAIGRLLAIAENYPQLKSNENFMQLQDELTGTENRVAVSRSDYNYRGAAVQHVHPNLPPGDNREGHRCQAAHLL